MFLFPSVQEINTAERHVCLTRDVQTTLSLSMETTVSKVTSPTGVASIDVFMTCSPYHLWSYMLINALFKWIHIIVVIKNPLIGFPFQVKTPVVNTKSKVLVPGLPGHRAPVKGTTEGSEKRKKDSDTKEVGSVMCVMQQCLATCWIFFLDMLQVYTASLDDSVSSMVNHPSQRKTFTESLVYLIGTWSRPDWFCLILNLVW